MEELIEKAKKGDRNAFVEAIKLIETDLFNIAYIKLKNIEDVNDAIQETILIAFEHVHKLKEPQYFKTWIIKILINECKRSRRKKYKEHHTIKKMSDERILEDVSIENKDNEFECEKLISKLSPKDQDLIMLYFYNGFSQKEIAKILNINVNTLKTRLRRAEEKMKNNREEGKDEE